MPDRIPRTREDYLRSAESRLNSAGNRYRQGIGRPHEDVFLERADVAMLVWSAGIDVASALMLTLGSSNLGTSSTRFVFLRDQLRNSYPFIRKPMDAIGWSHLAQLHNYQHNLDLSERRFVTACRRSARFFAVLNGLLPAQLRLPDDAYAWLLGVR